MKNYTCVMLLTLAWFLSGHPLDAQTAVAPLASLPGAAAQDDAPWPQWRGLHRDGVSTETGLLEQWNNDGPPLVWRIDGLGGGYSGVAVARGKLYTMGLRGEDAYLIALDEPTGRELWATKLGGGRPNSTPTVAGRLVFALGSQGDLVCADAETGSEIWRSHLVEKFAGIDSAKCGFSESPLVVDRRVIITPGAEDAVLVALDQTTGNVTWRAKLPKDLGTQGMDGAGYSSAVISHAAGRRQIVQLIGRGLISVSADDGSVLWTYNRIANGGANVPTPIVRGDYVFSSTAYGAGAVLLKIESAAGELRAHEVYFLPAKTMQNHHGGMVLVGDHLYCGHGHNQGFPLCIEWLTGQVAWQPGRGPGSGSAAVLYADGHLYFRYEDGVMALVEANPKEYVLKGTFTPEPLIDKNWSHPVIAGGRLYLRDQDALMCYDVKQRSTTGSGPSSTSKFQNRSTR